MARRAALWLAIGGVIVAAAAIALVFALRASPASPTRGAGPHDAGVGDARIDTTSPANPAARLIASAAASAAAGRYVEALADYQRAYALDPRAATLLEQGRMEHLAGRCRDARRTTQRVLADAPGEPLASQAQQLLDRIGRCD